MLPDRHPHARIGWRERCIDRWCKSARAMSKAHAALTSRLHKISGHLPHPPATANPEVLRLYENAYFRVPLVRLHESRFPRLKSGRLFPKAHGLQVMVYTQEHPPPHFHVEFFGSERIVRLGWPSQIPLPGEPTLVGREEKDVRDQVAIYNWKERSIALTSTGDGGGPMGETAHPGSRILVLSEINRRPSSPHLSTHSPNHS